jgi:hypothetical protein
MKRLIEVVVEDKEMHKRIVVATFEKTISLLDHFPEDLSKELFKFLFEKSGKFMGTPRRNFRDMNFFARPMNAKPFESKINKVAIKK